MTLLDERPSGKLCVTYHKLSVVDAIDEIKATTQRIPNLDIAKTKLTTLTSVQANGRSELLIAYNCEYIVGCDNCLNLLICLYSTLYCILFLSQ